MVTLLVIVDDFYVVSVTAFPTEADAPLVIDPNAVLTFSACGQPFQSIAR